MDKLRALRERLAALDSALVAFSGGVDSAFLLAVAREVLCPIDAPKAPPRRPQGPRGLGDRLLALTAAGAAVAHNDLCQARDLAARLGVRHVVLESHEIDDPRYVANPTDRCYFCKTELYAICLREARERGLAAVLSGTNADDLADWRPGLRAAGEHGVLAPLAEVGMTKAEIRVHSRALGLPTWDRPASPCLASRIPYGTKVTRERLAQIGRAESAVRALGFRELRVRWQGDTGRLELAAEEHPRLALLRAAVERAIVGAGFERALLDPQPFRSGRLNEDSGLVSIRRLL